MDIVQRLIVGLLIFPSFALAFDVPARWHSGTPSDSSATPSEAAQRYVSWHNSQGLYYKQAFVSCDAIASTSVNCTVRLTVSSTGADAGLQTGTVSATCYGLGGDTSYRSGNVYCTGLAACPSGMQPDAEGVCQKGQTQDEVCAGKSGKESIAAGVQWVVGGSTLTTKFCDAGCEARGSFAAAGGDGAVWITGPASFTGKSCETAQAEKPAEPIPNKSDNVPGTRCAMGQCPGYINGLWTCHKCSSTLSTSTSSSSSSTTNKDSTGATTGTTTTNTTTTSSTTCSGSTCTTTTTNETKNPDGTTSTTSSSSSQPKDTFCTQNPKAAACLVGAWGGSCAAGFTCDGDAVQCAIARENHKRNCELFENETADSQQGKSIANGQARPDGHPGNSPETVNVSGNIDQTNPYGGTCPPDISLSVYGKTVTIPLSNACDIFKWMGYIAVAFTMYAAARITMSGVSA